MPSASFAAVIAFVLSTKFNATESIGWKSEETLELLNVYAPPADPTARGVYPGFSDISQVRLVGELLKAGQDVPLAKRLAWFDTRGTDAQFSMHIIAYRSWFRRWLSKRINTAVDQAMRDTGTRPDMMMQGQLDDEYPSLEVISSETLSVLPPRVFGSVVMNGNRIANAALQSVKTVLVHTLSRYKKYYNNALFAAYGTRAKSRKGSKAKSNMWPRLTEVMKVVKESEAIDPVALRDAVGLMKDLLPHIEWLPSIAVEFTEHRQFVLGVAMGAGLDVGDEINDTGHAHVVEKGLDARSRGRKARIATETIDPKDLARVFEELTDFYKEPPNVSMTELMEGEDLFEFFSPDGDIGVTGWKDKSAEELSNLLGFDDGRPPLFAKYRALDATVNSWNSPRLVDWNGVGGDGVRPLSLQWHQLCGIASMADKTFTASDPKSEGYSPSTNILLADDVGLGKTGQIMGMIAFLVSVWFVESQQGNKSRPHVINSAEKASFAGQGPVPNLPHLIVVPTSLLDQWVQELKGFFANKKIEIHELPASESGVENYLTDPKSEWNTSTTPYIMRIVICMHSTFSNLAGERFNTKARNGTNPCDGPRAVRPDAREVGIFTMDWCVVAIDEIHEFRSERCRGFHGAVAIRARARLVIGGTATPIISQPKDTHNIARMLNVPGCCGMEGRVMELEQNRLIAQARRNHGSEAKGEDLQKLQDALHSGTVDPELMGDPIKAAKYSYVRLLQARMANTLIRRTLASKKPNGEGVQEALPGKTTHHYIVWLADSEHGLLNQELGVIGVQRGNLEIAFETFFIKYRMMIAFPLPDILDKSGRDIKWPTFTSRQDFDARAGTKLKQLISLMTHHLADDAALPVTDVDKDQQRMIYPKLPEYPPGEGPTQDIKILVYFTFSMMTPTLESAFQVCGINASILTGAIPAKRRTVMIDAWKKDPARRVLAFSNVAATGLNLAEASIVIHYDVNWSAVYQQQIDGRACRWGQTRKVHAYHLLATGTTDIIMNSMAAEKTQMLSALVTEGRNEFLEKFLSPEAETDSDSDESEEGDDDGPDDSAAKTKSVKPRAKTQAVKPPASSAKPPTKTTGESSAPKKSTKSATSAPSKGKGKQKEDPTATEEDASSKGKGKQKEVPNAAEEDSEMRDETTSAPTPKPRKNPPRKEGKRTGSGKRKLSEIIDLTDSRAPPPSTSTIRSPPKKKSKADLSATTTAGDDDHAERRKQLAAAGITDYKQQTAMIDLFAGPSSTESRPAPHPETPAPSTETPAKTDKGKGKVTAPPPAAPPVPPSAPKDSQAKRDKGKKKMTAPPPAAPPLAPLAPKDSLAKTDTGEGKVAPPPPAAPPVAPSAPTDSPAQTDKATGKVTVPPLSAETPANEDKGIGEVAPPHLAAHLAGLPPAEESPAQTDVETGEATSPRPRAPPPPSPTLTPRGDDDVDESTVTPPGLSPSQPSNDAGGATVGSPTGTHPPAPNSGPPPLSPPKSRGSVVGLIADVVKSMPPRPPPTQRRAGSPTNARQPIVGSQPLEQDMMSASETSQPHDAPNVPPEQPFEPRDQDVDMDDPDSDRHEDVDDPPSSFEYRQKAPFTQRGSLPEDPIESEGDDQNDSDDSNDDNRPVDPTQPATQFPSPPLEPWMEDNVKRGRSMRPPHVESQAGPSSKPGGAARAKRAHSDDSQEGSSTRPGRSTKVPPALNQQQADYQPQDLRVGSKPAKKVAKRPFVFLKERRGGR